MIKVKCLKSKDLKEAFSYLRFFALFLSPYYCRFRILEENIFQGNKILYKYQTLKRYIKFYMYNLYKKRFKFDEPGIRGCPRDGI